MNRRGQDRGDEAVPSTAPTGSAKTDYANLKELPTCANCQFPIAKQMCHVCGKCPLCRTCWHPLAHSCVPTVIPRDSGEDAPRGTEPEEEERAEPEPDLEVKETIDNVEGSYIRAGAMAGDRDGYWHPDGCCARLCVCVLLVARCNAPRTGEGKSTTQFSFSLLLQEQCLCQTQIAIMAHTQKLHVHAAAARASERERAATVQH